MKAIHQLFLSTLSLRRATNASRHIKPVPLFLSTLSLRRATVLKLRLFLCHFISIHALLAESDTTAKQPRTPTHSISIHALLAESDYPQVFGCRYQSQFLSTLSLRRATCGAISGAVCLRNFYPRSPCGERRKSWLSCRAVLLISIHALLAESDCPRIDKAIYKRDFYPRSPCGERHVRHTAA